MEIVGAGLQVGLGFDALAARRTDVLEIAESLQNRIRDMEDVVRIRGAEGAELPAQLADAGVAAAAQARLNGFGHHLLQRRVGDEECREDAGMGRIGATELQRGRRAIGLGIAGICREAGGDLIGAADGRIEPGVGIVSVQRGAELILQGYVGDVETAAAGDREGICDVEGVEGVNPGVLVDGTESDRPIQIGPPEFPRNSPLPPTT